MDLLQEQAFQRILISKYILVLDFLVIHEGREVYVHVAISFIGCIYLQND